MSHGTISKEQKTDLNCSATPRTITTAAQPMAEVTIKQSYDYVLDHIRGSGHDDRRRQWRVVCPLQGGGCLLKTASALNERDCELKTATTVDNRPRAYIEAIDHITGKIRTTFEATPHNTTYWRERYTTLDAEMSRLGGEPRNAADLREKRVRPLLSALKTTPLSIPPTKGHITEFKSEVVPQFLVRTKAGERSTCEVDYLLYGRKYHDGGRQDLLYLLPVEVRKEIEIRHYYQLAWHMMRLATHSDFKKRMMVGLLMDKTSVVVCFSALRHKTRRNVFAPTKLPWPVILATPRLHWFRDSHLDMRVFIFLGMLLQCQLGLERVKYHRVQKPTGLSSREVQLYTEVARELEHDEEGCPYIPLGCRQFPV